MNEYNHAWVLAEYSPGKWMAMETTGGFLVPNNPGYYRGIFFENPRDFKTYLDLMRDYNNEVERIATITQQYNAKVDDYNTGLNSLNALVDTYNNNYANRMLPPTEYQAALILKNQIDEQELKVTKIKGELDQLANSLAYEKQELANIKSQMNGLVNKGKISE